MRLDKSSVQDAHGWMPLGFQIFGQEYIAYDLDQRKTQANRMPQLPSRTNFGLKR